MKLATILTVTLFLPLSLQADTELEAYGILPAATRDANGDTIGGIGSGIVYDKTTDRFFCITDRGPGDGAMAYRPRVAILKISPGKEAKKLQVELEESVILRDEKGNPFTGANASASFTDYPRVESGRSCIDPEGIALAPDGTIYISDEYGPYLYQFRRDGTLLRRIFIAAHYMPADESGRADFSAEAKPHSGREINFGFEGLSILPSGRTAVMILQKPLSQDGGPKGRFTRIVLVDLASGKMTGEYAYPFEETSVLNAKYGKSRDSMEIKPGTVSVNDITTIDDNRFLVLERDGLGENGAMKFPVARYKSVWMVDIRGATNLLDAQYAAYRTPKGGKGSQSLEKAREVKPVRKQLLYNLPSMEFDFGKDGPTAASLGAKWEGLAVLHPIRDGGVELMMSCDNDFLTPEIHEEGNIMRFPRVEKPQDTLFLKVRARVP